MSWRRAAAWPLCAALATWIASGSLLPAQAGRGTGPAPDSPLFARARLRIGVGDRLTLYRDGGKVPTDIVSRDLGLAPDFVEIWLPRQWKEDWVPKPQLEAMAARGVTPVLVHEFFGDDVSRERFEGARDPWYTSLWRLAQLARMEHPVLVLLEPEWNQPAPRGETALSDWADFADDLRAAAQMIRRDAPNALVGTCPGDFSGPPDLERVLGPASKHLDFLAFQEMRGASDRASGSPGYLDVGRAAVDYATYLGRAFDLPVLLAYVAVSSGSGWEREQVRALQSLADQRQALRRAGVFGAIYFQLVDDPKHEGFFGPDERHFGLVGGDGRPKPAFKAFRKLGD